jgi:uncharacterized protein (DUF1810 family)
VTAPYNLERFADAQNETLGAALAELQAGLKQSHWMWFVFPQLAGLGHSPTSQFYAIASLDEARAYLANPQLGARLRASVEALLTWAGRKTAEQILGPLDAVKLRSSLTLFNRASPGDLFGRALDAFFGGVEDDRTLALLGMAR